MAAAIDAEVLHEVLHRCRVLHRSMKQTRQNLDTGAILLARAAVVITYGTDFDRIAGCPRVSS